MSRLIIVSDDVVTMVGTPTPTIVSIQFLARDDVCHRYLFLEFEFNLKMTPHLSYCGVHRKNLVLIPFSISLEFEIKFICLKFVSTEEFV